MERYVGNGSAPRPIGTAKIAAGLRGGEILAAAAEKNVTIVTGADPGVGIGGWITGGGHGPVTNLYGLGADQVVEMEVVAADGRILILNETEHCDLFWAMRGVSRSSMSTDGDAKVMTGWRRHLLSPHFRNNKSLPRHPRRKHALLLQHHCLLPRILEPKHTFPHANSQSRRQWRIRLLLWLPRHPRSPNRSWRPATRRLPLSK